MDADTRKRVAQLADLMPGGNLELINGLIAARDAEWNRAIGYDVRGPSGLVLSPTEAAGWLKKDRAVRARNVASESRGREVKHY